jgi:hypothetical protein
MVRGNLDASFPMFQGASLLENLETQVTRTQFIKGYGNTSALITWFRANWSSRNIAGEESTHRGTVAEPITLDDMVT